MGKCPFNKKDCRVDCVLYRRGMRYWDDPNKAPTPFEECAINVAVDCLENMVGRSIGQQRATESARNELAALKELFFSLASRRAIETTRSVMEVESHPIPDDVIEVVE